MKETLNKIKDFLLDYVWQFPQNLIGRHYLKSNDKNIIAKIDSNIWGCNIYLTRNVTDMALGRYIFVYQRYESLGTIVNHLIGHTLLSKKFGIFYMPFIGIPSLIWSAFCRAVQANGQYISFCTFYTELLADWEYAKNNK